MGYQYELKRLLLNQDIDTTREEFIRFFLSEIAPSIPENVLADKRLLAKHIKDFYRSKGSEESYKLLFRILYNEDIDLFYPGEVILRASDGRWVEETSLRVSEPITGDPNDFDGQTVTGETSGATARVERIVTRTESGALIFELFIGNQRGTFIEDEVISTIDGTTTGTLISTIGPIQSVEVIGGGEGHSIGDVVRFIAEDGQGANGSVSEVFGSSLTFTLQNGGSGYSKDAEISFVGGSGSGAAFEITELTNTEVITVYDDQIHCVSNVEVGSTTFGDGNTCLISSNLASSNLSSTIGSSLGTTDGLYGTISEITVISGGQGYDLFIPTVTIREDAVADLEIDDGSGGIKGFNANVGTTLAAAAISAVTINNPGQGYKSGPITIVNTSNTASIDATGEVSISGIITYPGSYVDTKGWLSWNNKLQDNYYYQEYSYEIQAEEYFNKYSEIVKRISHPSGTKMFGRVRVDDIVASSQVGIEAEISTANT